MKTPSAKSIHSAASAVLFACLLWIAMNATTSFGWYAPLDPRAGAMVPGGTFVPVAVAPASPLPPSISSGVLLGEFGGPFPETTNSWDQLGDMRRWVECVNAYNAERVSAWADVPAAMSPWSSPALGPFGPCGPLPGPGPLPNERWRASAGPLPAWRESGSPWPSPGTFDWSTPR